MALDEKLGTPAMGLDDEAQALLRAQLVDDRFGRGRID
jgi:hypothetical protein